MFVLGDLHELHEYETLNYLIEKIKFHMRHICSFCGAHGFHLCGPLVLSM